MCSKEFPIGKQVEPYDIQRENEMLLEDEEMLEKTKEMKELIKELKLIVSNINNGYGGELSYEESCIIGTACYYLEKAYLEK